MNLTPKQKQAILARDYPHISLSVEEAARVEEGERITLKPDVWITVLGVGKTKKSLYLRYSVRDDRPRLLRSSPHNIDFGDMRRRLDGYGTPRAVSDQDAEEASETSGYTDSSYQALEDAGEAVPREYQQILTMRAKGRQLNRENEENAEELARRQFKSFADAARGIIVRNARLGIDSGPYLARVLKELEQHNEEVAA